MLPLLTMPDLRQIERLRALVAQSPEAVIGQTMDCTDRLLALGLLPKNPYGVYIGQTLRWMGATLLVPSVWRVPPALLDPDTALETLAVLTRDQFRYGAQPQGQTPEGAAAGVDRMLGPLPSDAE